MRHASCMPSFLRGMGIYSSPTPAARNAITNTATSTNTATATNESTDVSTNAVSAPKRMSVKSLDGPVTKEEIQSFIDYIKTLKPQLTNNDNEWVQGKSGESLKAMSLVYDIAPREEILNKMLSFCDALLSIGKKKADGQVTWKGGGGAQGDVVGHLANCAKQILKTKAIYKKVAPGDGGKTYLDKAKHYLAVAEQSTDQNILGSLLQQRNDNHMFFSKKSSYKPGEEVPWNQQMMFNYAFVNLAQAYELLGNAKDKVRRYDKIVQSNIDWFFKDGVTDRKVKNRLVYDWGYAMPQKTGEDSNHGSLDVAGLYRLYQSGRYEIDAKHFVPIANTIMDVVRLGNRHYAGRLNGTSSGGNSADTNRLRSGFMFMALFRPDAYQQMMADAGIMKGGSTDRIDVYSRFLWVKQQRSKTHGAATNENWYSAAFNQLLARIRLA